MRASASRRTGRVSFAAIFVLLGLALAGCVTGPDVAAVADLRGESAAYASAHMHIMRPYVLRPNDQVQVQVYNESTISGAYQIDGTGTLSIPLAGHLKAAGLTTAQLERSIVAHLDKGILKDPHVTVQVAGYGPFFIRGEVKQPGQFAYQPGLTIGDAVALAGGYTYRADESAAYVRPAGSGVEVVRPLTFDAPVSPGDNIRIPERYF